MQMLNWNDLRYVLALQRGQTIGRAARLMNVDATTVSRRLATIQSATTTPLFIRQTDGGLRLTPIGEAIADRAEAIEHQVELIGETLGSDQQSYAGMVRLTSVPILINRVFAPRIGDLLKPYPGLEVELIPDSRDLSLTRREADLAIRLARPVTGGIKINARRIGQLDYSLYGSSSYSTSEAANLPWVNYDDSMAHITQAQWINRVVRISPCDVSGLKVHDGETVTEAVIAGHGKSLLPNIVADRIKGLQRISNDSGIDLPSRELWLLSHSDQRDLRRIRIVISLIEKIIGNNQGE